MGVGDENAPKPIDCADVVVAVGVPNCNGFVSIAGLLGVNVNVLCVVPVVFAFVLVFAVLIPPPNNGVTVEAVVVAAVEPNVNNGAFVDAGVPNWKALVSGKTNRKHLFMVENFRRNDLS